MAEDRFTVQEAARRLGVKEDAIRKRVRRGTLRSEKAEDGRVWVYLDTAYDGSDMAYDEAYDRSELVEELRDRLRFTEEQLAAEREAHREARRIIGGLVQRIPELPSAQEPVSDAERAQEPPPTAPTTSDTPTPQTDAQTGSEQRVPWWRRVFGS